MFNWLRNKLHIHQLQEDQLLLHNRLVDIRNDLHKLSAQLGATNAGLGRIVAKIDPMFGVSEQDPVRKAASDALGEAVIKRLEAEHKARQHTIDGSF